MGVGPFSVLCVMCYLCELIVFINKLPRTALFPLDERPSMNFLVKILRVQVIVTLLRVCKKIRSPVLYCRIDLSRSRGREREAEQPTVGTSATGHGLHLSTGGAVLAGT